MRTVLDDLDNEWTRLRDSPQLRAALKRWGSDAATGAELEARTDGRDPADADQLLHRLLVDAADDPFARLVALCLLLPTLHSTARRCYRLADDEAAAAVVAAGWEEISRYRTRARSPLVAATVARAIRRRAFRSLLRSGEALPAEASDPGRWMQPAADDYARIDDRDYIAHAQRRAQIAPATMQLLLAHRGFGQRFSELADDARLPAATLRQRASRAERAMKVAFEPPWV